MASIFGAFSILFLVFLVAIILSILLTRKIRQDRRASQVHIETNVANGTLEPLEMNEVLLQPLNSQVKQNSGPLPIPD